MGEAFDRDGRVLGTASGSTKREVFEKLMDQHREAAEIRIRSMVPGEPYPSAGCSPVTERYAPTTQPPPMRMTIQESLSELQKHLEETHMGLNSIESRLTPILAPEGPNATGGMDNAKAEQYSVISHIRGMIRTARDINARLQTLDSRVQL